MSAAQAEQGQCAMVACPNLGHRQNLRWFSQNLPARAFDTEARGIGRVVCPGAFEPSQSFLCSYGSSSVVVSTFSSPVDV